MFNKCIIIIPLLLIISFFCVQAGNTKKRILLGSPVSKKAPILKEFLEDLKYIKQETFSFDYLFVDDNRDSQSSNLLCMFADEIMAVPNQTSVCTIVKSWIKIPPRENLASGYHYWNLEIVRKVSEFKDFIIEKAIEGNYDYLFLIDSDLLLHPDTLEHLVQCDKEIIAEIFWTCGSPGSADKWANVWSHDESGCYNGFLDQLKKPGTYEAGMLGACTLISRKALVAGVRFKELNNLTFVGEDRHFCARAAALGLQMYIDTYYPAFHIYFDSDLNNAEQFKRENKYYQ